LKNHFTLKDNLQFKVKTNDNNEIHYNHKFTRDLMVKNPIVHGCNLTLYTILNYYKFNNRKTIDSIEINFKNYLNLNEKFKVKKKGNNFKIISNNNLILDLFIKTKKNNNKFKLNQKKYLKNLLYKISEYVGSKNPGNGSLILKIYIKSGNFKIRNITKRILTRNSRMLVVSNEFFTSSILATKLKRFEKNIDYRKISFFKKKFVKQLKDKKIIIFGSSGNLGSVLKKILDKFRIKTYLINRKQKLNVFKNSKNQINIDLNDNSLKKKISEISPDLIFFFMSPKITKSNLNRVDHKKLKNYRLVYYTLLKKIIDFSKVLKKKVKIFNPSTIALKEIKKYKHKYSREYIIAKKESEKIKSSKNVTLCSYRLPQFKGTNNYNIAGFYEGENLENLIFYIDDFIFS